MKHINLVALILLVGMGVVEVRAERAPRSAQFEVRHELKVTVPDGAEQVRVWFTMPIEDAAQEVREFRVESPFPHRIERDSAGNDLVYLEANGSLPEEFTVVETFQLSRTEQISGVHVSKARPLSRRERRELAGYLEADEHVVINETIRELAAEIVGGERNPAAAARKIYDWVLHNIEYWVKDPGEKKASPVGSTQYCLDTGTGNCTDFHSLWTSLARASGLPTRLIYGSFFKAELDGKDADQSYHCWPEFYVSGIGWVPHDVAVADIFLGNFKLTEENERLVRLTTADGYQGADLGKVEYYFGNIEERRVTWSRGRDLILSPRQKGGPVNAMAKAYVEVDGKEHPEGAGWARKLTYREIK